MKPMVREYIQTALFCGLMYITSAAAGQSPAPNADTTSELIRQIGSDNNVVRQSAFNALVSKGESALPDVFAALKDTTLDAANQRIRPRIPVLLRRFGAPQKPIADALISALGDDNPAVRSSAARALGKFELAAQAAVPALAPALSDPEQPVRGAAAFALADLSDWAEPAIPALIRALDEPLGNDVLDWSSSARTGAAAALGRIGAPAVPALIDALITGSESRKTTVSTILVRIGAPAVPSVSKALAEADSENSIHLQAILMLISSQGR